MIHALLEERVARWLSDAPLVASGVMSFLKRILPDVHGDAERTLSSGGRLRISVDLDGLAVTRFRVRLLRPETDASCNTTIYTWRPQDPHTDCTWIAENPRER